MTMNLWTCPEFCNAGSELMEEERTPETGDLIYHGLPFQVGTGASAVLSPLARRQTKVH